MERKPSILVVDDEPTILHACVRALGEERYHTRTAGTVDEARKIFAMAETDVALLDVKLPDGNGIELVAEARRLCPGLEIVVMTGHGGVDEAVSAVKAGAYDFLTKADSERISISAWPLFVFASRRCGNARKTWKLWSSSSCPSRTLIRR